MKKGLSTWITSLIIIITTLLIIAAMYLVGTGTVTRFAKIFFSQG